MKLDLPKMQSRLLCLNIRRQILRLELLHLLLAVRHRTGAGGTWTHSISVQTADGDLDKSRPGGHDFPRFSARHFRQIEAGRPITVTTLLRVCEVLKIPWRNSQGDWTSQSASATPATELGRAESSHQACPSAGSLLPACDNRDVTNPVMSSKT